MDHTDARCQVTLLGGFSLVVAGEPVELPAGAQRLVAFLSLHESPVPRSRLAGALWPDSTQTHAGASLRSALWRLRRRGLPLVHATSHQVSLSPALSVDVLDVRERARRLMDRTAPAAPEDLDSAALTGELLPDWVADEWVLVEREHLRQLCLHGLDAICQRLLELGRHGEAAAAALAAVRTEPLRESAHRHLIRVHLEEGNVSEALRQYRWYARLLRDELGIEPSPKIRRLVATLTPGARVGARTPAASLR